MRMSLPCTSLPKVCRTLVWSSAFLVSRTLSINCQYLLLLDHLRAVASLDSHMWTCCSSWKLLLALMLAVFHKAHFLFGSRAAETKSHIHAPTVFRWCFYLQMPWEFLLWAPQRHFWSVLGLAEKFSSFSLPHIAPVLIYLQEKAMVGLHEELLKYVPGMSQSVEWTVFLFGWYVPCG